MWANQPHAPQKTWANRTSKTILWKSILLHRRDTLWHMNRYPCFFWTSWPCSDLNVLNFHIYLHRYKKRVTDTKASRHAWLYSENNEQVLYIALLYTCSLLKISPYIFFFLTSLLSFITRWSRTVTYLILVQDYEYNQHLTNMCRWGKVGAK